MIAIVLIGLPVWVAIAALYWHAAFSVDVERFTLGYLIGVITAESIALGIAVASYRLIFP